MATPMTPEELRRQQQSLSEQIRQEQVRRAAQTREEGMRALAEQVRLQRQNMATGRQQLSEQAWSAQRGIEQQAQARGIGTSGLKNLSLVQSQMAQGRAGAELEAQNVNLQRAVMDARAGITRQAEGDIRSAEIGLREGMLSADREFMAADRARQDRMLTLLQLAQDPNMTPEMLAKYAEVTNLSEQEQAGILDAAGLTRDTRTLGTRTIATERTLAQILSRFTGIPTEQMQEGFSKLIYGKDAVESFNYDPKDGTRRSYQYTVAGEKLSFKTRAHAEEHFRSLYSRMPESDKIEIIVDNLGRVRFISDGKRYSKYNDALAAYRGTNTE